VIDIPDQRSGEERRDPHISCTAHSGLNIKINLLLILSTLATLLLGLSVPMLSTIQSSVAANTVAVKRAEIDFEKLDNRVRHLEQLKNGDYNGTGNTHW
jgi:hypothetical protein